MRLRIVLAAVLAAGMLASTASGANEDVRITAGPNGPTNDASPSFAFHATPPGAEPVLTCRVDAAEPAPCGSPYEAGPLADGAHVFEVTADFGAFVKRAHRSFTVDAAAPALTVDEPTTEELTASVGFSSPEEGIAFTCALDSGAAVQCASPYLTPPLRNGTHAVHVQAADAAGNVTVKTAQVTIAAEPPDTKIETGFGATSTDRTPEFGLRSTRAGSRFQCKLDTRAWADCEATHTTAELSFGAHQLAARAIDAAGNVDPSPAVKPFEVVECVTQVEFAVIDARAANCFERSGSAYLSDGPVRINGITFNPLEGQKLKVDPATRELSLGQIQLRIGSVTLYAGELAWTVPEGDRVTLACLDLSTFRGCGSNADESSLDLQGSDSAKLFGFELKGQATLELADGGVDVTTTVELPEVFTDAEGKGLTGTVKLRADNEHGMRLDGIDVAAPLAFVGKLELHNLWVSFAGAHNDDARETCNNESPGLRWEGGADAIVLPTPDPMRLEDIGLGFADGGFSYAKGTWRANGVGREIGGGVRVQKISFSLCAGDPVRLEGRIGLTAAERNGNPQLRVHDAGLVLKLGDPWSLRAEATRASLVRDRTYTFTDLFMQYSSTGAIDFGGKLAFEVDVDGDTPAGPLDAALAIDAQVGGFVDGPRFNADLRARGCFAGTLKVLDAVPLAFKDVCPEVEGVVSSVGIAVCGNLKVGQHELGAIGAGTRWGEPPQFMAGACDLEPFRAQRAVASAAAAGARSVVLPGGRRGVLVAVRGADGPPRVELRGPRGERVTTDPRKAVRTRRAFAFANHATRTTYVVLAAPRGGGWTAVPLDGARIAGISTAAMLPRPAVTAKVRGDRLVYRVKPLAGQRVVFSERGRGLARVVGVAAGRRGTLRLHPRAGRAGRRRVVATVEQGGLPRRRLTVATYRARGSAPPARPRAVRLQRSGRVARLTWARAPRAKRYGVRVALPDGRRLFFLRGDGDRAVRMAGVPATGRVSARVVGLRTDNSAGPAGTAATKRRGARASAARAGAGTDIDGGPSGVTTDASPTFKFSATEPATFECRVTGPGQSGAWAPCVSPHTLALGEGHYVFSVRAIDAAGNPDPTPATRAFTVDTASVETSIDAGPSSLTRDTTPSFSFGSETTGATYECRLDEGSWEPCTSPHTTARLGSGSHTFLVRAKAPGGKRDLTPARRVFAVDADAPQTTIVGGPAYMGETPDTTPTFEYASEPDATFECRLDRGDWESCPAGGLTTAALPGGWHTFDVRATDAVGNVDASPATRRFLVRACETVVRFGPVEVEGDCVAQVGTTDSPRWESEGDVKVNGLWLPAPGPAKVVLDGPSHSAPGGTLSVSNLRLELLGVKLYEGSLNVKLPAGDGGEFKRFDLSGTGERLFGMKVQGDAVLRLEKRGEAYKTVFALHLALPEIFRAGPEEGAGSVTGDVAIDVDKHGVHLGGLKVAVANAYVGGLGVKSVCLSYVAAGSPTVQPCTPPQIGGGSPGPWLECQAGGSADRWDGALAIVLPTASHTELGLWGGVRAGRLSHAGAYVDKLGTLVPLGPGIFLDRVAVGVCVEPPPFKIKGGAAIAFGPPYRGKPGAVVDGSFLYRAAHGGAPWMIRAEGGLTMFDKQVARAHLQYESTGLIDFGFTGRLAFGPASLEGGASGWVETQGDRRFNVNGHMKVCVDSLACAGATAVVSSVGAAGCITVTVMSVPVLVRDPDWSWWQPWKVHWESHPVNVTGGAGITWQTQAIDLMAGSCSLGNWQVGRSARSAQAGAHTIAVDRGQTAVSFQVRGAGAPPKVVLTGPDGRRVESPDRPGGAFVKDQYLLAENDGDDTTTVMVVRPAGGDWTVTAKPGSAAIAGVAHAEARPEPAVSGGVGGRGYRRAFAYAYAPQPGQKITFVERGPKTARTLGVARPGRCREQVRGARKVACGRLRFTPGPGPAGKRTIEALIEQDGKPRATVTVATYRAPAWRVPSRPRKVRVRRLRGRALVTWAGGGTAHRFNVVARTGDGRRLLLVAPARRKRVVVPKLRRADGVRIEIRGMRMDNVVGPARRARLKPRRSR